jgi:hypothetical protein
MAPIRIDTHGLTPVASSELLRAEGVAGYPLAGGALPVEGATQAGVQSCISSHSEREGEAPTASLVEGATRAPLIDSDGSEITLGLRPWGALAYRLKEAKGNLGESP